VAAQAIVAATAQARGRATAARIVEEAVAIVSATGARPPELVGVREATLLAGAARVEVPLAPAARVVPRAWAGAAVAPVVAAVGDAGGKGR